MVKVRFTPQAWINDYAVEVDPEGSQEWEVTLEEIDGIASHFDESREAVWDPDNYVSDELRYTANAPNWVKDWSGPFYCTILDPLP